MFKELFLNFTILMATVSITAHALREKDFIEASPCWGKFIFGIWAGLLGITLMLFSIQVAPTVIVDFRNIAAMWSAIYGGPIAALVTCFAMGSFRVFYFGLTESSITGFVSIIIMGIGLSMICGLPIERKKKYLICTIYNVILSYIAISMIINNKETLESVILNYTLGTIIVSYFMYLITEYHRKINELYRKLKTESQKDFLTGLNNVRVFDKELNDFYKEVKGCGEKISLLFLDIDFFKKINDTYGHIEGDRVLKDFSALLQKTCRDRDTVSRNGGEEFSVILRDCPLQEAIEVSERIRNTVEKFQFKLSNNELINFTISIGVANYPETVNEIDKLIEQADAALYKAKRTGRNKVAIIQSKCSVPYYPVL